MKRNIENIEWLASKLEPLLPDKVAHWRAVREMQDAENQALFDMDFKRQAREILGNVEDVPLFSLPPRSIGQGDFHLGNCVYAGERYPVGLPAGDLLKGMSIFGLPGSGKTNVVFNLILQLADKDIPFVFIDFKRTGRHLIPKFSKRVNVYTPGRAVSEFPFNPFIVPPGLEPNVYINNIMSVTASAYGFKEAGKYAIQRALSNCYNSGNIAPTIREIIKFLNNLPEEEVSQKWKLSAARSLAMIDFAAITPKELSSQQSMITSLLNQQNIVEVDGLADESKAFLLPMLALWLYYSKLASPNREKLSFVLVIEEAHNVLYGSDRKAQESPIAMILRQARELGMAIVVVDQHPHLISSAALGNAYTTITLNLKDPSDINKASALSLVSDAEKHHFSMLQTGYGIVKMQGRWQKPFLVKFPHVDLDKGSMSDDKLKLYLSEVGLSPRSSSLSPQQRLNSIAFAGTIETTARHSTLLKANSGNSGAIGHFPPGDIGSSALQLTHDIRNNPTDPVSTRYKRLGIGCKKGNRLKTLLCDNGLITEELVSLNRTRRLLLKLTDEGNRILGLGREISRRESNEHGYWKSFYAELLKQRGFRVEIEALREVGRTDISGKRGNVGESAFLSSIAVEVETGKNKASDSLQNIKQNLLVGYQRILIIATNEKALDKISKLLDKERLNIPSRIRVILRDRFTEDDFNIIPSPPLNLKSRVA